MGAAGVLLAAAVALGGAADGAGQAAAAGAAELDAEADGLEVVDLRGAAALPGVAAAAGGAAAPAAGSLRLGLLTRVLADVSAAAAEPWQGWQLARLLWQGAPRPGWALRLEAQARWGLWAHRDAGRQWALELALRQLALGWQRGPWQLRGGALQFAWGRHDVGAPADVLNPFDLRVDPALTATEPRAQRLPVAAVALRYAPSALAWEPALELVWLPLFAPHALFAVGHGGPLAAAGGGAVGRLAAAVPVDPAVRDAWQPLLLAPGPPAPAPLGGGLALRGSGRLGAVDAAATAVYGWERLPLVALGDALSGLLRAPAAGGAALGAAAAALRLAAALGDGQAPLSVDQRRAWQLALDAEATLGPLVWRADVGLAPTRVLYGQDGRGLRRPQLQGQLDVELARGDGVVGLGVQALAVLSPPATVPLLFVRRLGAAPQAGVALVWAGTAVAAWAWPGPRLQLRLGAAVAPPLGVGGGSAQLGVDVGDAHTLSLGGSLAVGLDQVLPGARARSSLLLAQYEGRF